MHPRRARLGLIEAAPDWDGGKQECGSIRGARASASLKRATKPAKHRGLVKASEARAPRPH